MISETGVWSAEEAIPANYPHSELLCFKLIFHVFKRIYWLIDMGCGNGYYVEMFWQAGYRNICGVDGHPNLSALVEVADLTQPVEIVPRHVNNRQVLCLEVGEHIPKQYEEIFINNLCSNCDSRMVLSWAVPGQGGIGHVNCRDNGYIIEQIESRGFKFNLELTGYLRQDIEIGVSYFRNTLMVFDKI